MALKEKAPEAPHKKILPFLEDLADMLADAVWNDLISDKKKKDQENKKAGAPDGQ